MPIILFHKALYKMSVQWALEWLKIVLIFFLLLFFISSIGGHYTTLIFIDYS